MGAVGASADRETAGIKNRREDRASPCPPRPAALPPPRAGSFRAFSAKKRRTAERPLGQKTPPSVRTKDQIEGGAFLGGRNLYKRGAECFSARSSRLGICLLTGLCVRPALASAAAVSAVVSNLPEKACDSATKKFGNWQSSGLLEISVGCMSDLIPATEVIEK